MKTLISAKHIQPFSRKPAFELISQLRSSVVIDHLKGLLKDVCQLKIALLAVERSEGLERGNDLK